MGSGARVSSGSNSKQDYQTPKELIDACAKRFGHIMFDLAAHAGNTQHERYFAPCTSKEGPVPFDPAAYGIDAFDYSWANLYFELKKKDRVKNGILWLNCEFDDIASWGARCAREGREGANILLLTPAAVGANWYSDLVAPASDSYYLKGRPAFIKGQTYNKDCMVSHFHPAAGKAVHVWDWRKDKIMHIWSR